MVRAFVSHLFRSDTRHGGSCCLECCTLLCLTLTQRQVLGPCHERVRVTACPEFLKCEARAQTWLNLTASHSAQLNHVIGDILCDIAGFFILFYFLAYVHRCFIHMDVCVRVLEALELGLQTRELPRGALEIEPRSSEEQPVLLSSSSLPARTSYKPSVRMLHIEKQTGSPR